LVVAIDKFRQVYDAVMVLVQAVEKKLNVLVLRKNRETVVLVKK
jgi:hypothetical protein